MAMFRNQCCGESLREPSEICGSLLVTGASGAFAAGSFLDCTGTAAAACINVANGVMDSIASGSLVGSFRNSNGSLSIRMGAASSVNTSDMFSQSACKTTKTTKTTSFCFALVSE